MFKYLYLNICVYPQQQVGLKYQVTEVLKKICNIFMLHARVEVRMVHCTLLIELKLILRPAQTFSSLFLLSYKKKDKSEYVRIPDIYGILKWSKCIKYF